MNNAVMSFAASLCTASQNVEHHGYDPKHFMDLVMNTISDMGMPKNGLLCESVAVGADVAAPLVRNEIGSQGGIALA